LLQKGRLGIQRRNTKKDMNTSANEIAIDEMAEK